MAQSIIDTLIAEAIGEGPEGLAAVAHVIRNRSLDRGISPEAVVQQPNQFTGYRNPGRAVREAMRDPQVRREVEQIWNQVQAGAIPDMTGGALHYYAPKGMRNGQEPPWWRGVTQNGQLRIGGHIFAPERPVPPASIPSVATAQSTQPTPPARAVRPTPATQSPDMRLMRNPVNNPLLPQPPQNRNVAAQAIPAADLVARPNAVTPTLSSRDTDASTPLSGTWAYDVSQSRVFAPAPASASPGMAAQRNSAPASNIVPPPNSVAQRLRPNTLPAQRLPDLAPPAPRELIAAMAERERQASIPRPVTASPDMVVRRSASPAPASAQRAAQMAASRVPPVPAPMPTSVANARIGAPPLPRARPEPMADTAFNRSFVPAVPTDPGLQTALNQMAQTRASGVPVYVPPRLGGPAGDRLTPGVQIASPMGTQMPSVGVNYANAPRAMPPQYMTGVGGPLTPVVPLPIRRPVYTPPAALRRAPVPATPSGAMAIRRNPVGSWGAQVLGLVPPTTRAPAPAQARPVQAYLYAPPSNDGGSGSWASSGLNAYERTRELASR